MGSGKSTGGAPARRGRARGLDTDELLERRARQLDREFFEREGEASFAAARRRSSPSCSTRADRRGDRARRRQRRSPTRSASALGDHLSVWLEVDAETAWERAAGQTGRWRATAIASSAARRARAALRGARRRDRARRATTRPSRAARGAGRAARAARGRADGLGAERLGRVPGVRRRRASGSRGFWPLDGPARSSSPTRSSPALYAEADRAARRRGRGRAGRAGEDARRGRARAARAGPRRRDPLPITSSRSAAASSATSPASARPSTSAECRWSRCRRRWSPRSIRPTAARPGSTCPRRRTTSAPTTCRPPCSPTRRRWRRCRASELAAGFVEVLKTALIAGGTLWERVRAIDELDPAALDESIFACARTKLEVVAADERDCGRRAGRSTSATRSATRSRRPAATRATATARPSVSGCSRRCGSPAPTSCAPRSRRCSRGTSCRRSLDPAIAVDEVLAAIARDKKRDRDGVGFVLLERPGEAATGERVDPDRVRAAVEELAG